MNTKLFSQLRYPSIVRNKPAYVISPKNVLRIAEASFSCKSRALVFYISVKTPEVSLKGRLQGATAKVELTLQTSHPVPTALRPLP